jgi:hypothetical protein
MNTPLRVNEALLIAGRAFHPLHCVAWSLPEGSGEISLTVIDRTSARVGQTRIASSTYSNPSLLADVLEHSRAELSQQGYDLAPWKMPE